MNTNEIDFVLKNLPETKKIFKGTIPLDFLPENPPYGRFAYVVNLDKAKNEGSHWISLYSDNAVIEYYDSFGLAPWKSEFYSFFGDRPLQYNERPVQAIDSFACGPHAIFYIVARSRHFSKSTIMNYFGEDFDHNDALVWEFVKRETANIF